MSERKDENLLLDAKEIHQSIQKIVGSSEFEQQKDGYRAQQALYQLCRSRGYFLQFLQIRDQQPTNQPPQADSKWSDSNISEKTVIRLTRPPLSQIH